MPIACSALDEPFEAVVSLGPDCRPAYQIARERFRRGAWRYREKAFKRAYWAGRRSAVPDGRFPFDDVIVPIETLAAYLRNDFAGFIDRDRLSINANGVIANEDGTVFFHAFTRVDGKVSAETLAAEYEAARQKYEYLIGKMRRLLGSRLRVLYVTRGAAIDAVGGLAAALSEAAHPGHDFFLLSVVETAAPRGLAAVGERCAIHEVGDQVGKVGAYRWEGDDAEWQKALGPIRLKGDSRVRAAVRGLTARLLPAR